MPKSFKVGSVKDPRVAMRAIIGVLLAANLAAAVVAFKPFGGSAEDLRRQQQALSQQLRLAQTRLQQSRQLVEKVQTARSAGDQFLESYFMDAGHASSVIVDELVKMATDAGIKMGQVGFNREPIEGSESLQMLSAQVGFEGAYANLTKFVNLLDKSPRFLIIENMTAAAPQSQGGQTLNVTLKIDVFVKSSLGAAS
jgi:type IV pilus assembly protein PilO